MRSPSDEFRHEYLNRLPLPLAQLYSRAFNAKNARERHDNAFYLFEALVKLAASAATAFYLEEIKSEQISRDLKLDRLLAQLALPSFGQWLSILREVTRSFAARADSHPWGKRFWDQFNGTRKDDHALLALYRRIKNGPDAEAAKDTSCSILQVLEAMVQYRNAVFGHGAGRMESFYSEEMGPLLFPALNELLNEERFSLLGPVESRLIYVTSIRETSDEQVLIDARELVGLRGYPMPPITLGNADIGDLLENRISLIWNARKQPLRLAPLLQYRESELAEEVLFLNRNRNGKQVEYLSYTTGRTERDRSMLPALAALLTQVTRHSVSESDLQRLSEQSLAETPSVEMFFEDQSPAGQQLGDYELVSEIGRGGMGIVYLAKQDSLGRQVALKVLPSDLATDEVALARFRREVRHLAQCDDPHIVKILASGTLADGRPYYTMEYVPGSDLEQIWKELSGESSTDNEKTTSQFSGSTWTNAVRSASHKQRTKFASDSKPEVNVSLANAMRPSLIDAADDPGGFVRQIVTIVRDAANALQSIHDRGIIHRDVKPANLMLTQDGNRVVLMDFGLAKAQSNSLAISRHDGGLLGTLRYAAPEQLAAANMKIGPAADVRGLGVTMWELLTCRRAFEQASDEVALMQEVLSGDLPRLRTIDRRFDRDLDAIVARATERRQSDRIQSANQLAEYLQLWLDGKPLPIRPPSGLELAGRWVREHKALSIAATSIVIMSAVTLFAIRRNAGLRQVQSQSLLQQLTKQSDTLLEGAFPAIEKELQDIDVDVSKIEALLDAQKEQIQAGQRILQSESLQPRDQTVAKSVADQVVEAYEYLDKRIAVVRRIGEARRAGFVISDESFRQSEGRVLITGRDGIPIYQQVMAGLIDQSSVETHPDPEKLAQSLSKLHLAKHLRAALDSWFSLRFQLAEREQRQTLMRIVNVLDETVESSRRKALRQAILAQDVDGLVTLASEWKKGPFNAEQLETAILLSDGLIENLRLGDAIDVLRVFKLQSGKVAPAPSRFSRLAAFNTLASLLTTVGSRLEIQEALQCLEAAQALDTSIDPIRLSIASAQLAMGNPMAALEQIDQVSAPELQLLREYYRGSVLACINRGLEARKIADRFVKEHSDSVFALQRASTLYGRINDIRAAQETAQLALKLAPGHLDLLSLAYSPDEPEYIAATANLPEPLRQSWWNFRIGSYHKAILEGLTNFNHKQVNATKDALRQHGFREWSLAELDFDAIFQGRNLNSGVWEAGLRQLRNEAPLLRAERYPSPTLASLVDFHDTLKNEEIQEFLLRESMNAPALSLYSKQVRLEVSGRLLETTHPEMARKFFQAAQDVLEEQLQAGYGNDDWYKNLNQYYQTLVDRNTDPNAIEDSDDEGKKKKALAFLRVGQANFFATNYQSARDNLHQGLDRLEELNLLETDDTELAIQIFEAWTSLQIIVAHLKLDYTDQRYIDQAIEVAERLAALQPEEAAHKVRLGRALKEAATADAVRNRSEAAQNHYERSLAIFRSLESATEVKHDVPFEIASLLAGLASLKLEQEDFESAKELYQQSLLEAEARASTTPDNKIYQGFIAMLYMRLGQAKYSLRNWDEAERDLLKAVAIYEHLIDVERGALNELDSLANCYFRLAYTQMERQAPPAEALKWFDKLVDIRRKQLSLSLSDKRLENELANSLAIRSRSLLKDNQTELALAGLDEAVALAPKQPAPIVLRSFVYFLQSKWQSCLEDLDQAAIVQTFLTAEQQWMRAKCLMELGRFEDSVEAYEELLIEVKDNPDYYQQAALAGLLAGKSKQPLIWLDESLKLRPNDHESLRYRANAYASQDDFRKALLDYQDITRHSSASPSAWRGSSLAAIAVNDVEGFNSICREMLEHLGEWTELNSLDTAIWACVWRSPGPTAIQSITEALKGANTSVDQLQSSTQAALHYRMGNFEQAEQVATEGLLQLPENNRSTLRLWLIMSLVHQRDDRAVSQWSRLKDSLSSDPPDGWSAPLNWPSRLEWKLLHEETQQVFENWSANQTN